MLSSSSEHLDLQVKALDGATAHVLSGGPLPWQGVSSEAFHGAWLERRARLQQASLLLSESAHNITQCAQTIEEHLFTIRNAQSILHSPASHTLGPDDQQAVLDDESQAQNAIVMALSALNSQLESLAEEVSDCPELRDEGGNTFPGRNNLNKSETGAGGKTPEQRIEDAVGDPILAQLLMEQATAKGANLEDVAALLEKNIDMDQIDQWLEQGANLHDVTTLINNGVDANYINAWIGRGDNIGDIATFVEGGVDPKLSAQLTRAGVNPESVLPLIQEGVAPETISGLIQSGVAPEKVSTVIEANIARLMEDSNPNLRLTRHNAIGMLNGPPGTYPDVAGAGVQGADVKFIDPKTGDVVLVREEKSITTSTGLRKEINSLPEQLADNPGPREVMIQVPRGTNAKSWIGDFLKKTQGPHLAQYKGIEITIINPEGNVLWEEQLKN